MGGKRYQITMAPSAHRRYKKFDPLLQQKIREESGKLAENPHQYQELRGPLRGIRSYHFEYRMTQYRIAYRIIEDKNQIEIVLVKSRESFYQILKRIIK
jgi:addiction module RelE/StbE family toxin